MDLGTYLIVWDTDGSSYHAQSRFLNRIGEAVQTYLDTGRDSLLQLTALTGDVYVLRASNVLMWQVTTPDGRRAEVEMQVALQVEEQSLKADFGIWEDD